LLGSYRTDFDRCLPDRFAARIGTKGGYTFKVLGSGAPPYSTFYAYANPLTQNTTGVRSFCSASDAVVRYTIFPLASCAGTETPL
jgi:hypothetical protein